MLFGLVRGYDGMGWEDEMCVGLLCEYFLYDILVTSLPVDKVCYGTWNVTLLKSMDILCPTNDASSSLAVRSG